MNVKELIAELQKFVNTGDGEMPVVFNSHGEWVVFTGVETNDTIFIEGTPRRAVELY